MLLREGVGSDQYLPDPSGSGIQVVGGESLVWRYVLTLHAAEIRDGLSVKSE